MIIRDTIEHHKKKHLLVLRQLFREKWNPCDKGRRMSSVSLMCILGFFKK